MQQAMATPVWVSYDRIEMFKGWKRGEIETFRRNNPHLCQDISTGTKPSWVYDKAMIDRPVPLTPVTLHFNSKQEEPK